MDQRGLNELRRRFRPERTGITRIYGCYVNGAREVISWVEAPLALMQQDEQEMYLGLLKKVLSGALGRNLIDLSFSTEQVVDSEEHRLLQTLRQSMLQDQAAREELCRRIIEAIDLGETNYLILLAAEAYDVPYRGKDDLDQADASDQVYRYFVCSICPVKDPKLALQYDTRDKGFHPASTGHIASAPELGFLFPAFDDRAANIYDVLFYAKDPGELHEEVIDALFHVAPPLSAPEQKDVFETALCDALGDECSYDVVQSVHEQLHERIGAHKESKDPEPLALSVREVGGILANSGVSPERIETFQDECRERYGDDAALDPKNLIEDKRFEIATPEVKITVAPEDSYLIEARLIEGRKYLLVPVDGPVTVNGIEVKLPNH